MMPGMTVNDDQSAHFARQFYKYGELIHAVHYFDPSLIEEGKAIGYDHYWTTYFATRMAPMGAADAATTIAVFYGWNAGRIAGTVPEAWAIAGPEQALAARLRSAETTLAKVTADLDGAAVAEAAELAWNASQLIDLPGRALGAANYALPKPSSTLGTLWQATTTLREHRGDGHNAVLVAHDLGPIEAHLLKTGSGEIDVPTIQKTRKWSDEDWAAASEKLSSRGLLNTDGTLTESGLALHQEVEDATDRAASAPWKALGDEVSARTIEALKPIGRAAASLGLVPGRR